MKKLFALLIISSITIVTQSQECLVGTSMDFALYLQNTCGIVYKEDGIAKNPFQSIKDHGGKMVRLRIDLPPYANNIIINEPPVDYRTSSKVKEGLQVAQQMGLKTMLTFSYQSFALNPGQALNPYVAPLAWQPIANDLNKLKDSVYLHTYTFLKELVIEGLVPEIVSIGNETNWRILESNLPENSLQAYSPQRTVSLLNAGAAAVRDINQEYTLNIRIALHIFGASNLTWWMNTHVPLGLDFDIMGLSHYHAWHSLGNFSSWAEVVNWVKNTYQKDFMILETAQLFSSGYSDNHINVLGVENIPPGYPNPPSTDTQKNYLKDFAKEILDAGGLGVLVWGGDWVGSDCYVYPDQYGPGSSWENKAFWDFNNNLHDGVNWMIESCPQNSVQENSPQSHFHVYPVPLHSDCITIETNEIRIKRVEVYSLPGQKLSTLLIEDTNSKIMNVKIPEILSYNRCVILKIVDINDHSYFYKIPVISH